MRCARVPERRRFVNLNARAVVWWPGHNGQTAAKKRPPQRVNADGGQPAERGQR